jgi:hypothetical protein
MPDTENNADAWDVALTLPTIALGAPIFNVVDQPGDCSPGCPCVVGPSDGSDYGMHWTALSDEDRAGIAEDIHFERTQDAASRYQDTEVDA